MSSKKHRVALEVTYCFNLIVTAEDEEETIIEVEKYIAKCDDYDVVNRSGSRQLKIGNIAREYPNRD